MLEVSMSDLEGMWPKTKVEGFKDGFIDLRSCDRSVAPWEAILTDCRVKL